MRLRGLEWLLEAGVEEFEGRDSGWTLKSVNFFGVFIHKYNSLWAGISIQLPSEHRYKNASINLKNEPNGSVLKHRLMEEGINSGGSI